MQLLGHTHLNVVIMALANKLFRMAWAVLCKNRRYRAPVLAAANYNPYLGKKSSCQVRWRTIEMAMGLSNALET
jgi:hypothetical protein